MRALIITTAVVILGLLGALVAGSLMDNAWRIERSVHMAAEPIDVFATVCNLQTWPQWDTWNTQARDEIQYTYSERTWGRGAWQRWQHGEQWGRREVTEFMPGQSMQYVQINGAGSDQTSGNETRMLGALDVQAEGAGSRLHWRLEGEVADNPLDKLFMRLYRRRIETVMEDSLRKLEQRYAQAAPPGA